MVLTQCDQKNSKNTFYDVIINRLYTGKVENLSLLNVKSIMPFEKRECGNQYTLAQFNLPSPLNPCIQLHTYEPIVFVQIALL